MFWTLISARRSSWSLEELQKRPRQRSRCLSFTVGASNPTGTKPHLRGGYDVPEAPMSVCPPTQRGRAAVLVPADGIQRRAASSGGLSAAARSNIHG